MPAAPRRERAGPSHLRLRRPMAASRAPDPSRRRCRPSSALDAARAAPHSRACSRSGPVSPSRPRSPSRVAPPHLFRRSRSRPRRWSPSGSRPARPASPPPRPRRTAPRPKTRGAAAMASPVSGRRARGRPRAPRSEAPRRLRRRTACCSCDLSGTALADARHAGDGPPPSEIRRDREASSHVAGGNVSCRFRPIGTVAPCRVHRPWCAWPPSRFAGEDPGEGRA